MGRLSHVGIQPYLHLQGLFTHLALEKYSNDKGTGCWGQEGGPGAGTDCRVLGTTQLTSAALVFALILAPRGDGDAGLRPELQGTPGEPPPPKSPLCLVPDGRAKPGRQSRDVPESGAVHISVLGASNIQVPRMSLTSLVAVRTLWSMSWVSRAAPAH